MTVKQPDLFVSPAAVFETLGSRRIEVTTFTFQSHVRSHFARSSPLTDYEKLEEILIGL